MSKDLEPQIELAQLGGNKKPIKSGDLDGTVALVEDQAVVIHEESVPADKLRWWGYGHKDLPLGQEYVYGDLVNAATGADIAGDIELRITDSRGRNEKANYELGDAQTLRDVASEDRSQRPGLPALGPYANPHRMMQVVVYADAASDGDKIDTAASTFRAWFTEYEPGDD